MFQKGEFVIYGSSGVCEVKDICIPDFAEDKENPYYKLEYVFGSGCIYAPVNTHIYMRAVLSAKEVENIIQEIPKIEGCTTERFSVKELSDFYESSLRSHDCKDLICLIKTAYKNNENAVKNGKNQRRTDQRFMKIAEEQLYGEFAVALHLHPEQVRDHIEEIFLKSK